MPIQLLTTDILILGNGLSGLRAAWAAKEHSPDLDVTLVSLKKGPSGSSFTNRNDALGIQLLDTDERRETFVAEATNLGRPGFINPSLATLLANEGEARFRELEELDLEFRRLENGILERHTACGSPHQRAVIFTDLRSAFNRFQKKTNSYDIQEITDLEVLGGISDGTQACGAWGRRTTQRTPTALRARCVIVALGGPAPLFAGHQAGSGVPGISYALLAEAGAALENTTYLQYMWGGRDKRFVNLGTLLAEDHTLIAPDGTRHAPRERFGNRLDDLLKIRSTHCPGFYHRPQAVLDQWLIDSLHDDGFARIETKNGVIEAGLSAHAGNGGAIVDPNSETSVFNLFAVGECATGMHGANRMGGAMVLATQVFGHRAGMAAAKRAPHVPLTNKQDFGELCQTIPRTMDFLGKDREYLSAIREGMRRFARFGGQPGIEAFRERLEKLTISKDRVVQLTARAALEASSPLTIPATACQ